MTMITALSKDLFEQVFIPALRQKAPEAEPFIAAGLVGEGSECFGYDDELSRDHDFGPGFCVWLKKQNYARFFEVLEQIVSDLPRSFGGLRTYMKKPRRGILQLEEFCAGIAKVDLSFLTDRERDGLGDSALESVQHQINLKWMSLSEPGLAALVNGTVFLDHEGSFTELRSILLRGYPEDVRLYKLAQNLLSAAQISQYNYPRTCKRKDVAAMMIMKGRLAEYNSAVIFLLNHRFRPYYKWSSRALGELPLYGREMYDRLSMMGTLEDGEAVYDIMSDMNALIVKALHITDLSDIGSPFLTDHLGTILMKITDRELLKEPLPLL